MDTEYNLTRPILFYYVSLNEAISHARFKKYFEDERVWMNTFFPDNEIHFFDWLQMISLCLLILCRNNILLRPLISWGFLIEPDAHGRVSSTKTRKHKIDYMYVHTTVNVRNPNFWQFRFWHVQFLNVRDLKIFGLKPNDQFVL